MLRKMAAARQTKLNFDNVKNHLTKAEENLTMAGSFVDGRIYLTIAVHHHKTDN